MTKEFNEKLNKSRNATFKRMDKTLLTAKFDIIVGLLKEKGIEIPSDINNIHSLEKYLKQKVGKDSQHIIDEVFKKADETIEELVGKLKKGSTTAFGEFLNKLGDIIKPLGKSIINALAIRTAIALAPTISLKLAISSLILIKSGFKLNKTIKYKNIVSKSYECNRILNELETTKNEYGNVINTRFDDTLISYIKDFLKRNNISYNDTGYLSLRECLYKLSLNKKVDLINMINNFYGNKIDINKRLNDYNETLKDKLLKNTIKPITIGGAAGAGVATAINAIEPAITTGIYNGTFVGTILAKLSESKIFGFLSGGITAAGSYFLKYIPLIGPALENFLAYENIIVTSVLGSIAFFGLNTLKCAGKSVINIKNNIVKNKKYLNNMKKDSELYYEENMEELKKRQEYYAINGPSEEDKTIMVLVIKYMEENNIVVDKKINSIDDLRAFISKLNNDDKHKINKLLTELESLRKNNYSYFKKYISRLGKMIYLSVGLSLAGLSIIDIIKGGDFLEVVSEKIGKQPGKIEPIEVENMQYTKAHYSHNRPIESKAVYNSHHSHTEIIEPQPAPAPAPSVKATPSPELAQSTPIVCEPTIKPSEILPTFLNNSGAVVKGFNNQTGEEIYNTLFKLGDKRFIDYCSENMSTKSLVKLNEYIMNAENINPSDFTFNIIKDSLNKQVNIVNNYIDKKRRLTRIASTTIGAINIPIDNEYEHYKTK